MKANGAPEKYIPKSDLVAEIEKWLGETDKGFPNDHNLGRYDMCKQILSFLDTLEVKEVDFEEELKHYCNDYYNCDYPKQLEEGSCSEVMPHIVSAAKYFFELGLKAQKGE